MRQTIAITVDTKDLKKLERYRRKVGLSRSLVVRWAIQDYLKKEELKNEQKG